jgi:hypothetical protein
MYQYVIYPDHWVVRQFRIGPGTIEPGTVITAESLEEARAYVPTLLTRLPRMPEDDPTIVEVWL